MERTVKVSTNIQLVRIGLVKSVDYKYGDRMESVCACTSNTPLLCLYVCLIYFFLCRLNINHMMGI